jgi:hypothetical protein
MKLFEPIRIIARSGDPHKNPVVVALAHRTEPRLYWRAGYTIRDALTYGVMLAGITLFFSLFLAPFGGVLLCLPSVPTSWFILFVSPSILSINAATLTASLAQHEDYHLAQLTALNSIERVQGFLVAALHRLRLLLSLSIGLSPIALLGTLPLSLLIADPGDLSPTDDRLPLTCFTAAVGVVISLAGIHLLGAVTGVASGLWKRRTTEAGLFAFGFTSSITLLIALGIYGFASLRWFALAAILAVVPYLLALAALHLAARWA